MVLRELRKEGMSILVVEQNLALGVSIADRVLIMDHGRIALQETVDSFRHNRESAHRLLGVL